MAALTLPEFVKRTRDELIAGVCLDIYTTNPLWTECPWIGFAGSGVSVNRENTLGDSQFLAIGGTITAKDPSAVDQVLFQPTTCIGDAEINQLEAAMSASDINDVIADEVSSKSKSVGRNLQNGMATGDGASPNMNSLPSMIDSEQYVTGGAGTFEMLDALIDKCKSKDGYVDWIMAHGRDIRMIRSMLRGVSGVEMREVQMGDKTVQVVVYNGIMCFQNDFLSIEETAGGAAITGGDLSSIYCGNWDDGTKKIGCSMIYPQATTAGISVEDIGSAEAKDEKIYRVKAYTNFCVFNKRGVARLTDMTGVKA